MVGIIDRVLAWLVRRRLEASRGERTLARMLLPGGRYGWPGGWSQDRIEQVQHYKHWTYVAVRAIAHKVAQLTPNVALVHDVDDADQMPRARPRKAAKALTPVKPHEELEPIAQSHPLVRLLRNPNEPDTAFDLWYELVLFLELTGQAFLWAVPNQLGLPAELWVVPSHWVWIITGTSKLVEYYEVHPWALGGSGQAFRIPADEMIHIKLKSPIHKLDGYSPQTAGALWIDTVESVDQSRWSQFKNGAMPGLHIELDEQYETPTDDQLERYYRKFIQRFQGERNTGRPIITPPGAKIVPITWNPTEMAYVQSAEQIKDWVLALYGVPKAVVGLTTEMTYGSVLAAQAAFCTFTVNPLLAMLGQTLTEKLAARYDERLRIWWDDCTPQDPAQLNADLQADLAAGAITPNEWRALRGRPPYEHGGDDPLLSMGVAPMPLNSGEDLSSLAALMPGKPGETANGELADLAGPDETAAAPADGDDEQEGDLPADEIHRLGKQLIEELLEEWTQEQQQKCGGPGGKPGPCPEGGPDDDRSGGKPTGQALHEQATSSARGWLDRARALPRTAINAVRERVKAKYKQFESRYGRKMAIAILAAGLVGTVNPIPGSTILAMAPVIGVAELYLRLKGGKRAGDWIIKSASPIRIQLPDLRQDTDYSCGASAMMAVCEYFGVGPESEDAYREALGTNPAEGTSVPRIVAFATAQGLAVEAHEGMTLADLERHVDQGRPVIVLLQAWGDTGDSYADDTNGHYVIVIGYDNQYIYVEDPSLKGSRGRLTRNDFERRWHDEDSRKRYVHWGMACWRPQHIEDVKTSRAMWRKASRNGYR
jgi:HK97 family phage portal protein